MFENPKEFGKWDRMGSTIGGSVAFNSSHVYPLLIDDYVSSVKKLIKEQDNSPLYIELRPTYLCNHKCGICYSQNFRDLDRNQLSLSRVMNLLCEARDLGVKEVRFCGGGEPLMWKGIDKAIENANELGFGVMLISNGSKFSISNRSRIVENCHYIRLSINGGMNTHKIFHGCSGSEFNKIIDNVQEIAKIRSSKRLTDKLYLAVTYILTPYNISEVFDTAKTIKENGFDGIYFRVPTFHSGFTQTEEKSLELQSVKCKKLVSNEFYVHFAKRAFDSTANPTVNQGYCFQSQLRLYIESTGNVSFCAKYSQQDKNSLGNINDKSLFDIWMNSDVKRVYKKMKCVNCLDCDNVYFNRAMDFISSKLQEDSHTQFYRIFRSEDQLTTNTTITDQSQSSSSN